MKKKIAVVLVIVIMLVVAYVFLTPQGAVRFAILREGYPKGALTISLFNVKPEILQKNVVEYTLTNFTVENPDEDEVSFWQVYTAGIIKWGKNYGEILKNERLAELGIN